MLNNNKYVFDGANLQNVYVTNRLLVNYASGIGVSNRDEHLSKIHGFLEVASVPSVTYNGAAQEPVPKVTWCGIELDSNNYSVSYSNNVNAGKGTVTLTGIGKYSLRQSDWGGTFSDELVEYTAAATGPFTINPVNFSASVSVANQSYTGSALTPASTVVRSGKALNAGTDYTFSYRRDKRGLTPFVTSGCSPKGFK